MEKLDNFYFANVLYNKKNVFKNKKLMSTYDKF